MTTAVIQNGAIGPISVSRGAAVSAAFLGYGFVVDSTRYAGIFAVYGSGNSLSTIQSSLVGGFIKIRFNPSNPNESYIVDLRDSRFGGLTATQNPEWINQAPSFSIEDALSGRRNNC